MNLNIKEAQRNIKQMFNNVLDKDLIIAELLPDLPRVNEQLFLEIYLKSNTKIRVIKFGD